jgi:hypothetical protein
VAPLRCGRRLSHLWTADRGGTRATPNQSGRLDLNQRPFGPQPNALPDCATPRGPRVYANCPSPPGAQIRERATGIEPAPRAWKALVQPLHHARAEGDYR